VLGVIALSADYLVTFFEDIVVTLYSFITLLVSLFTL
jgi:hypothetical protein